MTEEIVFCKGGGCTAKLGPDLLSHVLGKIPRGEKDPDLLIGYDSRDDAAVYQITENTAIVQKIRICLGRLQRQMLEVTFMRWAEW